MGKKLGRNDLCWCGSGLKYKKCHIDREKQEPTKLWDASKELRKAFSTKDCLAPEPMKSNCSKTFVKAHTVPKNSLKQIARNGHVYSFIPSLSNIAEDNGILRPRLLGISKASTFTGFCSVHDNAIFSKIEKQPFLASQEQCFLLAYRALAREIYMKKSQLNSFDLLAKADRGKPPQQQLYIQNIKRLMELGSSVGLRDSEHHKALYDEVMLSGDFSSVHGYIIELHSPPPIMCCSGTFPKQDFKGNNLNNLINLHSQPHLLNFNSFYGDNCGIIVFTWLSESDPTCIPFIDSLKDLPPDSITDGLLRFFFSFSENIHIKPDWWENLSAQQRDSLTNRLTASANLHVDSRYSDCITDDGIRYDNWSISDMKSISYFPLLK